MRDGGLDDQLRLIALEHEARNPLQQPDPGSSRHAERLEAIGSSRIVAQDAEHHAFLADTE